MARYKIKDLMLSEILGEDVYLDPNRNYAEVLSITDELIHMHVVFRDAQAEKMKVYVDSFEAGEIEVKNGWADVEIFITPITPPIAMNLLNLIGAMIPLAGSLGSVIYGEHFEKK